MEQHVARAIIGPVAEIFRPVGGIAELDVGADDAAHLGDQIAQRFDEGKPLMITDLREPAQLGADAEGVDPARGLGQRRVMQDEARKRPLIGARIDHAASLDPKIRCPRRADERLDLGARKDRPVRRAVLPGRARGGDPAPPRQGRLAEPAIGIGQVVALELLHQDEGIEHDRAALRVHPFDRGDDGLVGGRAAIDRRVVDPRDLFGGAAGKSGDFPLHVLGLVLLLLDLRLDLALPRAQIVTEPAHDERDRVAVLGLVGERAQRLDDVGHFGGRVDVDRRRGAAARALEILLGGGQHVFAGAGQKRDALQQRRHVVGGLVRAQNLEGKLGHAVAEILQLEILQHDISRAAIGGHFAHAFDRLHLRVGQLVARAGIDPHVQILGRDLDPVRPDPRHARDLALAERERHADRVVIGGDLGRGGGALAAVAALGPGLFGEMRGPDDLPADAHAPVGLRNRAALAGIGEVEAFDAPGLDAFRSLAHQALVDRSAERGPGEAPPSHHRQPQEGAAHRAAERGTRRREEYRRHGICPYGLSGKVKRATMRRAQGRVRADSTTPWPE
ncbi:hypothetical protein SAMN05421759_102364 [Roseivivax lentus]|uniref:Uncharacterized protein n=1 Tax=Roseivivax lentus TaxID=633194 RepID=A0A1N7L457_9RHOB|nr:hypothetical protein SAMN05421759_102364 [Roseivivax lentus]